MTKSVIKNFMGLWFDTISVQQGKKIYYAQFFFFFFFFLEQTVVQIIIFSI